MAESREDPARKGGRIGGPRGGAASLRSEKVSAAQIQVYLKGIDYPVNKQILVQTARSNNAPPNVMSFISRLPERQYARPNEVEQEFGKLKSKSK